MPTTTAPADAALTLSDGRTLAYAEHGDPGGSPLLFVHGFTASRLTRHPDDALTASLGVRLITLDRPGCGGSEHAPDRALLDFPGDVRELAAQLGVDRLPVLGHSAGGPYALACALRLPELVRRAGVACGFAPMDRPGATEGMKPDMARAIPLLRRAPWLARPLMSSLPRQYRRDPARAFERQFGAGLPDCDRRMLERPELRASLLDAAVESVRGGAAGLARELRIAFAEPWGFEPADVRVPVHLWYGEDDAIAPPQMGRWLAARMPNARLTVYPGEGHMAYISHWSEMLTALTAR